MENILNDLIIKISKVYDESNDKDKFGKNGIIDCVFTNNLKEKLDELEISYDDSKVDFLAKGLLFVYDYDKFCLLMTKKYLENPNTGRVSNSEVYMFCQEIENLKEANEEEKLRDIKDSFLIKAGDFSMVEKISLYANVDRNDTLEKTYGIDSSICNKFFNEHKRFSSCYKGTVEALKLKSLGIKEYHQKLFGNYEAPKVYKYKRNI